MPPIQFNRDEMAKWYARQLLQIYYLPNGASDREIRFIEVNRLLAAVNDDELEPLDFGVDTGAELEHKLFVLDVTPSQWDAINRRALALPGGWTLEGAVVFPKQKTRR
jgi:hypothetical protein